MRTPLWLWAQIWQKRHGPLRHHGAMVEIGSGAQAMSARRVQGRSWIGGEFERP
jgi:hypothetical protein